MKKWVVAGILVVLIALVAVSSVRLTRAYRTQLTASARSLVEQQVRSLVDRAVMPVLAEYDTGKLVDYTASPTTVNVDGAKLSLLADKTQIAIQDGLSLYRHLLLSLPRGAFLGSAYLADKGRNVDYTLTVDYSTDCRYLSSLESAGINRVRYSVYLQVDVSAHLVVPLSSEPFVVTRYVPVVEYVFAGEVPGVYVNGTDSTNYLDLIP